MQIRTFKYLFIYGFLLFLLNQTTSLLITLSNNGYHNPIMEMIFVATSTWVITYYGVIKIVKLNTETHSVGSKLVLGIWIALIASLFSSFLVYILTKKVIFIDLNAINWIIAGYAGKSAIDKTNNKFSKILFIIGLIVISVLLSKLIFNFVMTLNYKQNDISVTSENDMQIYVDKKFGYTFNYPKSWKQKNLPLSPGYVEISPKDDLNTTIYFWYKDSEPIKNIDELLTFVNGEASFASKNQDTNTVSIEKTMINKKECILWISNSNKDNSYVSAYYFADYLPSSNQLIHVWTVGIITEDDKPSKDTDEINNILNSFKLTD